MGVYGEAGDDGLDRGGQYHRVGCLLHEGSRMEGENKELKHLALEAERRRLFLITGGAKANDNLSMKQFILNWTQHTKNWRK